MTPLGPWSVAASNCRIRLSDLPPTRLTPNNQKHHVASRFPALNPSAQVKYRGRVEAGSFGGQARLVPMASLWARKVAAARWGVQAELLVQWAWSGLQIRD